MTAQIDDIFEYNDKNYSVSAIEYPDRFFVIQDHGIDPEMISTACYRGYVARFKLLDKALVLHTLDTNNSNGRAQPVALNSVRPDISEPKGLVTDYLQWRDWRYESVNLPIRYTGAVLIADEFIADMYVHMGHQAPVCYREVIQLSFRCGELVRIEDLSTSAQRRRDAVRGAPGEIHTGFPSWIEKSFDRSYMAKWNPDATEYGSRE